MDNQPRVMVLGGDGFCGWPTSVYLLNNGYDVVIVDNLSRRKIEIDLEATSLTPIATISERIAAAERVFGHRIQFYHIDVALDYDGLLRVIKEERPNAIVHFAEQRAAPYSMKSPKLKRYTVSNNLNATHNILCAIVEAELDIHLVHLGTMGVYGYGGLGSTIPEGYVDVDIVAPTGERVSRNILHPVDPGSIYHLTKTQDQLFFQFYNKNDGIRITDLHQGIVWGTNTMETGIDEQLINRFDFDGDYGTVLNRFLMQAAIGYPLTVHGTGGQKRAFIHIQDSVRCIELALGNPPSPRERVRIYNQMTETFRVRDLAELVSGITGADVAFVDNPRYEAVENDLAVSNSGLLDLGLNPTTLGAGLLHEVMEVAYRYKNRVNPRMIPCTSTWNRSRQPGAPAEAELASVE